MPELVTTSTPLSLRLISDPDQIFAAHCADHVTGFVLARGGDNPTGKQGEAPDFFIENDGRKSCLYTHIMAVGGSTLAIGFNYMGQHAYLIIREGQPGLPWQVSTRMLILPVELPEEWGAEDVAFAKSFGRIMLFAGLVTVNGWWRD